MTLVVLLLLGLGSLLIVSAIENVSIEKTAVDIWTDNVQIGQGGQSQNTGTMVRGGQVPFTQPSVASAGVQPVVGVTWLGSAAGPSQQDAYRQAVVRAYLQSRR